MKRTHRVNLAKLVLSIIEAGGYENATGNWVDLHQEQLSAVKNSKLYTPAENLKTAAEQPVNVGFSTSFGLRNETTLQACRRLVVEEKRENVAALNFASAKNAGGGFLGGSQAQEESLARSSGLYPTLLANKGYYDANRGYSSNLYTDHMIWSPEVPVFLTDEGDLLADFYQVSFITAPAPNAGAVRKKTGDRKKVPETMKRRIELVLGIAAAQGQKTLVLGAFGCGVFRNDPVMTAEAFGSHLLGEGQFAGAFEHVEFAVLDKSKDKSTFKAFEEVFGGYAS